MNILDYFKENYDTFSEFDGKLGSYNFRRDIIDVFEILMERINDDYLNNCSVINKNPNDIFDFRVLLDKSGNCYLEVTGADSRTKIIVIRDDLKSLEDYENVRGRKIFESTLRKILDVYQNEKIKNAYISKRFLKSVVDPIDLVEEFECEKIKSYYEYLRKLKGTTKNISIQFEAPQNILGPKKENKNPTEQKDRVNDVIDYDVRKQVLTKYRPKYVVNLTSTNGSYKFETYVYVKDGFYLAVCEPISGKSYSLFLNIGPEEYISEDMLLNNIKAALEAKEEIVLKDDAIIRKSHTSLTTFQENIEIFLDNKNGNKRFLQDIKESMEVYGKH